MAKEKKSRFRSMGGSVKEDMISRTEESKKRQAGSGKWADFLVPDFDGKKWSAKDGDHLIDIVPYITGEFDPKLGPDKRAYMLDVWVHQKVGVTEDAILCPASNYRGQKCPICEYIIKMQQSKQFTDDEMKPFKSKRRVLYNIICYDTPEEENKGVQIWEASYHLTEDQILPLARNRRGGQPIPFADPDEGKSISFYREGTGSATRYKGYQFVDREAPISDDDLEAAHCLDELLDIKTYEEIEEMFMATAPEIPGASSGGRKAPPRKTDEEESHEERGSRKTRGMKKDEEEEQPRGRRMPPRAAEKEQEFEEEVEFDEDDEIPFEGDSSDDDGQEESEEEEEQEKEPVTMSRRRRR